MHSFTHSSKTKQIIPATYTHTYECIYVYKDIHVGVAEYTNCN